MALTKQGEFEKKVTDLPDSPSPTYTANEIKEFMQTPADELKDTFNQLIDDLTDSTGANEIGAKDATGNASTVQNEINKTNNGFKGHKESAELDHPDKSVTTRKLADRSVTTDKIAEESVTSGKIAKGSVTNEKIATGALDGRYYTQSQVDSKVTDLNLKDDDLNKRIDNIVASAGNSNSEIVDARNDGVNGKIHATLKARLDETSAQLADIVYQVKSNGVGDSDNINSKINLISLKGGGTLLLPDKEYLIDKEINFKSNVKMYSQQGTVLKQKNNSNLPNMIRGVSVENAHITNITFDLNIANQPNYVKGQEPNIGRCIFFSAASKNIGIDNVTALDMFGTVLYIVDSTNIIIDNVEIHDTFGRYTTAVYLVRVQHAKVSKSRFFGQREFEVASSSYAIQAKDTVSDIVVDNCYFEKFQCLLDGSENGATTPVNRGSQLKITNNVLVSPAADTTIRYCKFGLMSNNIVRNSGDYGLSVGDSENILVSDNLVEGSNTVGIGIRKSVNCVVSNNIVRDPCMNFRPNYPLVANQRVGIYVVGDSTRIIIDGNTITDYQTTPSQMFHAIRIEDYANATKGNDTSYAVIGGNVCFGSSSGIDIYADGTNNKVNPTNLRNDNKNTGISLGTDPFAAPKLGDLRQNALKQKPYFYDGSAWRLIPKVVSVPTSSTANGKEGDIAYNSNYLFICYSDNAWKRIAWDTTTW